LICLTTMTRMVEEGRTQIGILKALGYRKGAIAAKYIMYALLATAIGSIIGIIGGQKLLPAVIINAYAILYSTLPKALTPIHFSYSVTSAIPAVFATTLAAFLACRSELREVPASLMRPEAPKTGKRILLERLGFLWKRLSFSQKSTMRNLFRYKKRFWMTVLGIGGCMGLLLVGFGLRDSIMAIGNNQFDEIRIFSGSLTFDEDVSDENVQKVMDYMKEDNRIVRTLTASETSVNVIEGDEERSSYLTVIQDPKQADDFLVLRDRKTKERFHLDDSGVIITEKLAKLLNVKAGDTISLQEGDGEPAEVTVTAVAENYFYHYVYITASLYEEIFHTEAKEHDVFFITGSEDEETEENMQKEYMDMDGVSSITFTSEISDRVSDMMRSMDAVIYVIVIAAGMLAFVVLYNLNNINICERKRELATLKVLGFYDVEVSGYVLRENIWLTFFGCIFGIFFGLLLHRYVILTAEIDMMMFGRKVNFGSFVLSILLTWIFSALVNLAMYFRLKRINMVESLKSIE
jgi:putative ABC transport system permease protein